MSMQIQSIRRYVSLTMYLLLQIIETFPGDNVATVRCWTNMLGGTLQHQNTRNNVHSLLTVYEDRRHKVVTHRPSSFTVCQWSTPRSTEAVLAALDGSTPFFFFYLVTQNWVFIIVVTSTIGPILESTTPLKDWHAGAQGAHVMLDAYGCKQLPAAAIRVERVNQSCKVTAIKPKQWTQR